MYDAQHLDLSNIYFNIMFLCLLWPYYLEYIFFVPNTLSRLTLHLIFELLSNKTTSSPLVNVIWNITSKTCHTNQPCIRHRHNVLKHPSNQLYTYPVILSLKFLQRQISMCITRLNVNWSLLVLYSKSLRTIFFSPLNKVIFDPLCFPH